MRHTFYLKVNRSTDYALYSIDYWMNVANSFDSQIFIVCDDDNLQDIITQSLVSDNNEKVVFIRSLSKEVESVSKRIAKKNWKKASDAHLTTFLHAIRNNIDSFWNIDADDTSFCISYEDMKLALIETESTSYKENINVFSLDMWWTIHGGDNWTFGITYVNMKKIGSDLFKIIEKHAGDKEYIESPKFENVDSYFNYLRNIGAFSIESFYFNNTDFIHWGSPFGPLLYKYNNGYVRFPYYLEYMLANTMKAGKNKILDDVIEININYKNNPFPKHRRRFLKSVSVFYGMTPMVFLLRTRGLHECISIFLRKRLK